MPPSKAQYTVGIDLGTSHTVVAYAEYPADPDHDAPPIALLAIEQAIGPGQMAALPLLPSVRYHPAPGELPPSALHAPWPLPQWPDTPQAVMGHYARDLGAQVPGRLVSSAKSWLSHAGVDRTAAILPWGGEAEIAKISPLAASASYLAYVRAAWNARFAGAPLEQQDIVLTVPASFDEGARALTLEAAQRAGLSRLRLLEEPQAAFHDWLFRHRHSLAAELAQSRRVLVCDVGGGTTDLTLIAVEPGQPVPSLKRVGVGEHLMLGGDNMDLALAHWVEKRLASTVPLSAPRFAQLVQRCRVAKEQLLGPHAPPYATITLVGAGAQLVGAARSVQVSRDEVVALIADGFLPPEGASVRPQRRRAGIVALGLPYPADPAITRHVAAFLANHTQGADAGAAWPDTLLLNGGVFRSPLLAQRLAETLSAWRGAPVRVLHNDAPDVAVARGAVAYALVRGGCVPVLSAGIGGGAARSYFLLLDEHGPRQRGVCVLPRGTAEGVEVTLHSQTFGLRVGKAVRFPMVSSVADVPWQAGQVIDWPRDDERFVRLPPIETVLSAPAGERRSELRVQLTARMTEVGTLEMHCIACDNPVQRWLLAFQLRAATGDSPAAETAPPQVEEHPRLSQALALIEQIFGSTGHKPSTKEVRQLRGQLEKCLGPREDWGLSLLRSLFDALWQRVRRRRRSAEHERVWLNLAGYCLRPGTGAALDAWRIEKLWEIFPQGIQYVADSSNWTEWWTLWRRAGAGLNEAQQLQLLESLAGHLEEIDAAQKAKAPIYGSYDDMVRLAATLEQISATHRADTGRWLLERLQRPSEKPQMWWALGRLGARVPLYGSSHNVVPAEVAVQWLEILLALDWKVVDAAAFAAVQIARLSGDRARDVPASTRQQVLTRLAAIKAPERWSAMVREVVQLDEADQRRSFGEGLPPGLVLLRSD